VGARSHVSARYRLESGGIVEQQSSSGMIVSTGAGSTGWLSSVFNMLSGVAARLHDPATGRAIAPRPPAVRLPWEARQLVYVVREPFISKMTTAKLAAGLLDEQESLVVESLMGPEGTIFSDGIEADALPFSEGAIATISLAKERARLVVP